MGINEYLYNYLLLGSEKQVLYYNWLMEHGSFFELHFAADQLEPYLNEIDEALPTTCFYSAQKFILAHPEFMYFEGWYNAFMPAEHAFLVQKGKVLDLTSTNNVLKVTEWFGVKIPTDFVESETNKGRGKPLLYSYYQSLNYR